uniref:Uncharacterized protein n=1 Tax=Helianthus annuus TaxID=4232 RepID=A0A2P1MA48_HELAN|nr:hypothetical protein [Helianthus annuus]AYV91169.1 hypothetical protein [Helianthus annuus]
MGVVGHKEKMLLKLYFFSYDISSWIKRSLLNEVSLTVQEFRSIMGGKEFTQDHRARERAFAYLFNRALLSHLSFPSVTSSLSSASNYRWGELGRIARLNKRYDIRE